MSMPTTKSIIKLEPMTDSAYLDRIIEVLRQMKHINIIDQLRPNDTYTIRVSDSEFIDLFLYNQSDFKSVAKKAVIMILQEKH